MNSLVTINHRKSLLSRLFYLIENYEREICQALKTDLGKSEGESYLTEIALCKKEIKFALKHLKKWTKPKLIIPSLLNFPALAYMIPEPLGRVLVIGPWNYPFMLMITPLASAIAAGNQVVLKPSEMAESTALVLEKIIKELGSPDIKIVIGGIPETTALLKEKFDHIFYTGNGSVGKIVMRAASEHLTPVTLELGGKSPCVVFSSANIRLAARRIVWGKFTNAGQTCVAPDYLLVEVSIKELFSKALVEEVRNLYSEDPKTSEYGRIINERHFDRLNDLSLKEKNFILTGSSDRSTLYIPPTIFWADESSLAMKDEIFGPLLPILTFKGKSRILDVIKTHPKPLAAYVFSTREEEWGWFKSQIQAGGICINDTLIHMADNTLPFGGVGPSGMGRYRGKYGFDTFTHEKPVMRRYNFLDFPLRYPPYFNKLSILKRLLKWL
ncbi:MAG: aldehyde dehydrogenase [Bacteriovoracaceae bacterium]